jgi:8-amino-7-oxononanoate synthase
MSTEAKREELKRLLRQQAIARLKVAEPATPSNTGAPANARGANEARETIAEGGPIERHSDIVRFFHDLHEMLALGLEDPFFRPLSTMAADTAMIGGRRYMNFSSYNYLGLCGDPRVSGAAQSAIEQYGTSASASRIAAGERPIQRELELALAQALGTEDCVVFVSGHATNVTTIGHLFGPSDLILHDSLIHNSALQGALMSGARRFSFPHNDWRALDQLLTRYRSQFRRCLIVLEGLYSMDGDFPALGAFVEVKRKHQAWMMIDEAHSIGVLGGRGLGIAEHCKVPRSDVDIWMGTLSKTLASCGGFIAGSADLVKYLKYTAPGFVFSVGMPPPNAAAAKAALALMLSEPDRVARLQARGSHFLARARGAGLRCGTSCGFGVIPVIVGDSAKAINLSNWLFAQGINVSPLLYPAVEPNDARLRFFITSMHTEDQIDEAVRQVVEGLRRLDG